MTTKKCCVLKCTEYRCYCCLQLGKLNDRLFGKELSIWFTVRVFRERLSICVLASFHFGFKVEMWNLIVLIPSHCLSIYFNIRNTKFTSKLLKHGHKYVTRIFFSFYRQHSK